MSHETSGQVIAFYSYKGGTGRSMALANVACLLAQRQVGVKGVLMVDWDLEAPGLHRFFHDRLKGRSVEADDQDRELDQHPGLIDLFWEVDTATRSSDGASEEQIEEIGSTLLDTKNFERFILKTHIPSLYLLKAGRFDEKYSSRVNTFQWEAFYNRAPWLFRSFAERLTERYQYVLIDSRTGLTDISGICTMLMPEKLVVVFTPNRQSLSGVQDLIRRATNYRRQSDDLRPLVVFPLPSRIETGEPTLRDYWRFGNPKQGIKGYQPLFEELFKEVYKLPRCELNTYFDEVQIQHVPSYAYGEEVAVLVEQRGDSLSLTRAYERFTECMATLVGPWENPDQLKAQTLAEQLNKGAEKVFARMTPEEQAVAQRVFTRLVRLAQPEEGGEDTALRVKVSDLGSLARPVVQELLSTGLLERGQDDKTGEETVQAHEALIRGWRRLRRWIEEDQEFLLWRQQLRTAIAEWVQTRRDEGNLLRGAPLAKAEGWLQKRQADLNQEEQEYIHASLKLRARELAEHKRRPQLVIMTSTIGLLVVLIVTSYVWMQRTVARESALTKEETPIERMAIGLQQDVETFLVKMEDAAGTTAGGYAYNKAFYRQTQVALSSMRVGTEAIPKNELTVEQINEIEKNIEHLRLLHEKRGNAGLTKTLVDPIRTAINTDFTMILTLELAKKRAY